MNININHLDDIQLAMLLGQINNHQHPIGHAINDAERILDWLKSKRLDTQEKNSDWTLQILKDNK